METEYSSYRLGMSKKRACWLSDWLNDKVSSGKVAAKEMQQGREARLCGYRPGLAKALPGTTARVELGF